MHPALLALALAMPALASVPLVDFDRMGTVGLAGAFAGLGIFDNSSALSFDASTSSLRLPHEPRRQTRRTSCQDPAILL